MRKGKGVGLALALIVSMAAARAEADGLNTVSCDGFILGYNGQVEKKKCSTEERESNHGADTISQIEINNPRFYLVATYYRGKLRTYFPYRTSREVADGNTSFSQINGWEDLPDFHGFKVSAFSAVLAGQKDTISCAIFTRFSGTTTSAAEYYDGPGSKNVLEGYYCPQGGFASTAPGSAPMTALEDDIGKLQVPSE